MTAHSEHDARRMCFEGVDVVLQPFTDAADAAVELMTTADRHDTAPTSDDGVD